MIIKDAMKFNDFSKYTDERTGYLHLEGVISRTGLQKYLGSEVGDKENPTQIFNVYRPKDEVLKQESLNSYLKAPVTLEHPTELVSKDNASDLAKGSCYSVETFNKDGIDYVKAKLEIRDKELIQYIQDGNTEISAGYAMDLIKENGTYENEEYQYKQTNIDINHIAIVESARCGVACKLTIDKDTIINDVNITKGNDGMEEEIEVEKTAEINIEELAQKVAEILKAKEQPTVDEDPEEMKDEDMEETAKAVDSKVEALLVAKDLGLKVTSKDSIMDIKKSIIATKSDMALDGVCKAGIDTAYKMVISQIAKDAEAKKQIEASQNKAFDGMKTSNDSDSFANLRGKEY